jgi:hypothetical protein
MLLVLVTAVHVGFFACLGAWLSLVFRTAEAARTAAAGVLAVSLFGLFLFMFATFDAKRNIWMEPSEWFSVVGVANPMGSWWYFAHFPDDPFGGHHLAAPLPGVAFAGVLAFAALAGVLWLDALRRLRRYRVS